MPPAVAVAAAVVGGALASSAAVIATVGTIGAMIVGGVVSTGINMLGNKLLGTDKPKAASSAEDSGVMINVQDNIASIPIIYGRRRIAGRQIYASTTGASNKFLHLVYALGEGEIQEIERIVFGDNEIVFDGQVTPMTATSGTLTASQARGKYTGFVDLQWRLGTTTQTAFTSLVTDTAGQEGNWTGDHKALGVALIYIKVAYDKDKMNQVPTVFCDIKGRKIATSFGGGAVWSDNPAACLLDYLTNTTYGKGLALTDIDETSFNAARDYCDAVVSLYTDGTTVTGKRYLCNGFLDPDTAVFDNIKSILSSFNGYLLWANGKYKIKVFKDETNTGFVFDENNILGDIAMQLNSKETLSNRVKAQFYNSGLDYADDYAIWEDEEVRNEEDNGEILEREINLPFTSDYTRALNLCKMTLEQSRLGTTVNFTATPDALRVEVGDRVWFSHPYLGFLDDYRVTGMILNPDKTVSVTLMQYDDNIYSLSAITTAPGGLYGPGSQGRSTKYLGVFGVKPDAPTGVTWFRFCPGAVEGVEEGYSVSVTAPTTGKTNYKTITFSSSVANTTSDTIALAAHALNTGDAVVYSNGGGTSIGGLTTGLTYYAIRIDAGSIKLATTEAFALAGTFINLTAGGAGLAHTLTYGGDTVGMTTIDYYKYTVKSPAGDRSFTSSGTNVLVPETAWVTGTVTNIEVQAVANDGIVGEIGTTSTLVLNPDAATFCPFRRPVLQSLYQVCDGSAGVNPAGTTGTNVNGISINLISGPANSKWRIKWRGGPDVQFFTQYQVSLTLTYNGTLFYTGTTATVSKTAGATVDTVETHTFANIAAMPTFDPADPTKDIVVSATVIGITATAVQSLTQLGNDTNVIATPDAGTACPMPTPGEIRFYELCDSTGGAGAPGSGSGSIDIAGSNGFTSVKAVAHLGVKIIQPNTTISGTNYEVELKIYKNDVQYGSTVTNTVTPANNTDTIYHLFDSGAVFDLTSAYVVRIEMRIRGKRTISSVDYFGAWRNIAAGLSGDVGNDFYSVGGGGYGKDCRP